MRINYLPRATVLWLNALYHGWEVSPEEEQFFTHDLNACRNWLLTTSLYSLDDEELSHFRNLEYLLDQVDLALREGRPGDVCAPLFEVASLAHEIQRKRSQPHFSSQPPLNRLLLAGAAFVQGRGGTAAVHLAQRQVGPYLASLQAIYRAFRRGLPRPARVSLVQGFVHVRKGLLDCRMVSDKEPFDLRPALARLQAGGELLQHLLDWVREAPPHPFESIPGVSREQASAWADGAPPCGEELESIKRLWETLCPSVILPAGQREASLQAVEQAWLRADPAAMAEAFEQVRRRRLRLDGLVGVAGLCAQTLVGILSQTTADMTLHALLQDYALEEPVTAPCLRYLEGGQIEELHLAAEALVELHALGDWICPDCQQPNSHSYTHCRHCDQLALNEVTSWLA
ncbi:hypothetical protein IV102_03755 [bacterium]|nr:hypothetical protein [bacterium]